MKRAIAFFFLTAYLLFATELGQLLKITAFVGHYIEHQQQNNDINVWEFICIHYAHDNVKDADYDKDMKLPFKTYDHCGAQVSITVPPSSIPYPERRPISILAGKKYFIKDVHWTSSAPSKIWQPPKAC